VPRAGAGWRDLFESGHQFVPCASDVGFLREGGLALLEERRAHAPAGGPVRRR
jgi:hypothetical protein